MDRASSEYYQIRQEEELHLAKIARNPAVSGIHRDLAARYGKLAQDDFSDVGHLLAVIAAPASPYKGDERNQAFERTVGREFVNACVGRELGDATLDGMAILVVEDDPSVASELAFIIGHLKGRTVGPVATVTEALALIETERLAAAILDASLLDGEVTPLALRLIDEAVPFVIHTGAGLPARLVERYPDLPTVMKPASSAAVLTVLMRQLIPSQVQQVF